jgi:putative Holliday junction resolvase
VCTWDERLTSVQAERILVDADVSRRRRREVIHQMAAAIILQSWLDSQANSSA